MNRVIVPIKLHPHVETSLFSQTVRYNNLKNLNKYMSVILIPKANSNIYSAKRPNVQEKFEELLVKVK